MEIVACAAGSAPFLGKARTSSAFPLGALTSVAPSRAAICAALETKRRYSEPECPDTLIVKRSRAAVQFSETIPQALRGLPNLQQC